MSSPTITGDSSNVNISNADLVVSQDVYCNKVYNSNYVSSESDLDSATATNYHGMTMHVHGTGALYYAHGGQWRKVLTDTSGGSVSGYTDPLNDVAYSGDGGNLSNVFTVSSSTSLTGSEASGTYYPTLHQSGKIQRKDVNLTWEPSSQKLTAGFFVGDGGLLSNISGGSGSTPTLQQVTNEGSTTTGDITANAFFDSNGIIVSGGGGSVTIDTTPTEVFPSNVLTVNMASGSYKTFTANINQDIDTFTVQNHTAGSQGIVYLTSNLAGTLTINGKTSGLSGTGVEVGYDDLVLENIQQAIISFTSDGSNVFTNAIKYPSGVVSGLPTLQQITNSDNSTTNKVILQGGMVTGNVATTANVIDGVLELNLGGLSYKTFTCETANSISNISVTGDITGTQGIVFVNATSDITVNGSTSGLAGANVNISFDDMDVSSGEKALLVFTSDGTDRYFNAVKYPSVATGGSSSETSNLDQVVTQGNVTSNTLTVGGLTTTSNVDAGNVLVTGTITAGTFVGYPKQAAISVRRNTNGTDTSTTGAWVKVGLNTTRKATNTSILDLNTSTNAVDIKKTGTYFVSYTLTTGITSGTDRSTTRGALSINGTIDGTSLVYLYNRVNNNGINTGSHSMVMDLADGDYIQLYFRRESGTSTIRDTFTATELTVLELLV